VLPERIRYVGPQLDDPAWTERASDAWPGPGARPLVLVSLGTTYQNQDALLERVLAALGADSAVRVLVTLGGQARPRIAAPENVRIVASAAHHNILPRTAAVVCHGGHGTIMKALAYGVPAVVIPLGRDQADNAARVALRGAGLRLRPASSARKLRAAVQRCLRDPELRAGAGRLRVAIQRDLRADVAVRELRDLVAQPQAAMAS
jgi:MGT family glycosyltransferase